MNSCMRDNSFHVVLKQLGKPYEMLVLCCFAGAHDPVNVNLHASFGICFALLY